MKVMSLETPSKPVNKSPALLFEEEEVDEAPEVDELADLRTRFVGDIELTEGTPTLLTVLMCPLTTLERSRATAHGNKTTICIVPHSIPRGMHFLVGGRV